MKKDYTSDLVFKRIQIDNITYNCNNEFDQTNVASVDLEFEVGGSAKISSDKNNAIFSLNCSIFENKFKENKAPFMLKIALSGYFSCKSTQELNIEDFKVNAFAILFPYLRSAITNITAISEVQPLILPPINVYKLLENNKETME